MLNRVNALKRTYLPSGDYTLHTAQKMKFSIEDFFGKCDQIRSADLVTFTEEILNGKLHFLCSDGYGAGVFKLTNKAKVKANTKYSSNNFDYDSKEIFPNKFSVTIFVCKKIIL